METIKVKALKISEEVNEAVKAKERSVFEYQQEIANKFNTTFSGMQLEFEVDKILEWDYKSKFVGNKKYY